MIFDNVAPSLSLLNPGKNIVKKKSKTKNLFLLRIYSVLKQSSGADFKIFKGT